MPNNTITAPKGFLAAGLTCGVKKSGKPDLGIIVCPTGAKAAALFTTNKIVSAAVAVSKKHIKSTDISAVIVNSGNANACTGSVGLKNAEKMCTETAKHIEAKSENILVASTGIIGEQLQISKILKGISKAIQKLSSSASAGLDFAKAIMTTDTKPKQSFAQLDISGKTVTIAGTVKGAGMIGPNMATTLLFITTDVAITKPL
ncbi:MAG: bifunctional ornithine acetyltransferase/N-acetylglutamate synthase, partial [Planctomycetota bacterium]